jgi:hypothetical protein
MLICNVCCCRRSFAELARVLEPGKAAKSDKSSIITDAIRIVTQLRAENGQLRQLNKFLEVRAASSQMLPYSPRAAPLHG